MAFVGHFWAKNAVFFVMATLKPVIISSITLQNTVLGVQHPQNGVWGPTTDHSSPKNTALGKKNGIFWPFLGKKCGFFVTAAPKQSITCSKTLQSTSF